MLSAKDVLILLTTAIGIIFTFLTIVYFVKWFRIERKKSIEKSDSDIAKANKCINLTIAFIIVVCSVSIIPISFSIVDFFS